MVVRWDGELGLDCSRITPHIYYNPSFPLTTGLTSPSLGSLSTPPLASSPVRLNLPYPPPRIQWPKDTHTPHHRPSIPQPHDLHHLPRPYTTIHVFSYYLSNQWHNHSIANTTTSSIALTHIVIYLYRDSSNSRSHLHSHWHISIHTFSTHSSSLGSTHTLSGSLLFFPTKHYY